MSLMRDFPDPGPYVFLATFGTYLVSKEVYVIEHEFWTGAALLIVLGTAYK